MHLIATPALPMDRRSPPADAVMPIDGKQMVAVHPRAEVMAGNEVGRA